MATQIPDHSVVIQEAETLPTYDLLCKVLVLLNDDKRARFIVSRSRGGPTVQCLRVMLSRTRKKLEAKGRRYRHFKMHSEIFPWTEADGSRKDCVILSRTRNQDHEILEDLEALIDNG